MDRADEGSAELRRRLVRLLRSNGSLKSGRVAEAFERVPREAFVREYVAKHGLAAAYADEPIAVKRDAHGVPISSSSQPAIMATMLDLLEVEDGARVLEIGAGTGYNAALLDHLVGTAGSVTAMEVDIEIADRAGAALASIGSHAAVVLGDGRAGWPAAAPHDRIIVTASAADVPRAWRDQLVDGGLLVLPLRPTAVFGAQFVTALRRVGERFESESVVPGAFMGLRDAGAPATIGAGAWDPTRVPGSTVLHTGWHFTVFLALAARSESELPDAIREWEDRGKPPVDRLRLTVTYDAVTPGAWRTISTPSGYLNFDWA